LDVAKIAGIPKIILDRAKENLHQLELVGQQQKAQKKPQAESL